MSSIHPFIELNGHYVNYQQIAAIHQKEKDGTAVLEIYFKRNLNQYHSYCFPSFSTAFEKLSWIVEHASLRYVDIAGVTCTAIYLDCFEEYSGYAGRKKKPTIGFTSVTCEFPIEVEFENEFQRDAALRVLPK